MHKSRGAIVLCGGRSSRMGRDKALLPFGRRDGREEVLVQRVVRLIGAVVPAERIVCVAAADQLLPALPDEVQVVRDAEAYCGPLAGLAMGMAAVGDVAEAVFVCSCDAPLLVPASVARMFALLADHQVAVPHDGTRFHPLAAVYRVDVLPMAASLLAAGERRLMTLVERCETLVVSADELREIDPELTSLVGCNTPEEYRQLVDRILSAEEL